MKSYAYNGLYGFLPNGTHSLHFFLAQCGGTSVPEVDEGGSGWIDR